MSNFETNADLKGGYYGRYRYDAKNNVYVFEPLGKQVTVDDIVDNIETNVTSLMLSFRHRDRRVKRITVPRKTLGDASIITELSAVGADVTKEHANVFIDSLRLQEEDIETSGRGIRREYSHLGWKKFDVTDDDGNVVGREYCYRASKIIGHLTATYTGDYFVTPVGSWETWKQMVLKEVLGRPLLEVLLLAGLVAVINGLVAPATNGENVFTHIFGPSSTGKSTLGKLICSVSGAPFSGHPTITCRNGTQKSVKSLYRSWAGTETAIIGGFAGNCGAVVVMNELGKLPNNVNLSSILYCASEAGDKERGNEQFKVAQTEAYYTSIVSIGEFSILDKVGTKDEGLRNRILEIGADKFTTDAAHSRRINDVCMKNNGHAAPMMAKHIIESGGLPYVLDIYNGYVKTLPLQMPDSPTRDRFVEKFVALFLTTAEIASTALGIPFNLNDILEWFYNYELENADQRNTSKDSYHKVVEECHINKANFYYDDNIPRVKAWGAIQSINYRPVGDKLLVEEILIRRLALENILREHKYRNMKNCLAEWHKAGLLSRDKDKPTRSRIVEPNGKQEDVYVIRVFGTPPATNSPTSAPTAPSATLPRIPIKPKLASAQMDSKLRDLLADEEDDDE